MSGPGADPDPTPAAPDPGPRRPRVVVVEDDPEILDLETFLLSSEGFDVVPVHDGGAAVPTIRRTGPDLVLLDLMLPGKDGNEVLEELEQDPATAAIPVIVVSAFTERLVPSAQVRQVFSKPFDVSELLDGIARELAAS